MKFALWLPSYVYRDASQDHRSRLRDCITAADEAGLDIWVIDHLLTAPGLYGVTWLEPIQVLTFAAALTKKVRLATGILILPVRHPVILAKEIATLDYLSNGRYMFGIGTGWYGPEYDATGGRIQERGARTDEMLAAVRRLLTEDSVTFEGRFYNFREVTIEPRPAAMPPVWVSGGARVADSESPDTEAMAPRVLDRIVQGDGWLSRSAADLDLIKRDWATVSTEVIRRRGSLSGFTFGHCNFIHVVDTADASEALRLQRPPFMEVMGTHRPFEQLQRSYLLGTPAQQVARLIALQEAGCEYVVLGPTTDDPHQIELLVRLIVEPVARIALPS
ncbi:MAG: LLM class flavin-dependent oxidoreductase [Candidatus Dormibacteraeota bacterium]|nr:LLM class flavin-dependent oxidoreductase [Candidatus Dormibacteraeota bacterium]